MTYLASRPRYYQALATTLVKLYATALMVLLNGRMKLGSAAHPATWSEAEAEDRRDGSRSRRGTVSAGVHDMSVETQSRSRGGRRARDSDLTAVERASPPRLETVGEGEKGGLKVGQVGQVQSAASSSSSSASSGVCVGDSNELGRSLAAAEETTSERSRGGDEVSRPDSPVLP